MIVDTSRDIATIAGSLPPDQLIDVIEFEDAKPIVDVTRDSREVLPGWAFACVVGEHFDGHDFAVEAVDAGAAALLVERPLPFDVPQVVVRDVRRAMGWFAAGVHGHPATKLRAVGITGTNGKTTTSHLVAAILRSAGVETRVQGTLSGVRTTPEATDLQRLLAEYVADGVEAVVMEVSSHALALHRVAGMQFDVAVFTNLGRDHLDLHESMEAYFRAKASLFDRSQSRRGVTNVDDPYGRLLLDAAEIDVTGFSLADASHPESGADRVSFEWRGRRVVVPLGGHFNVMNALAALTAADVFGIDPDVAVAGIATTPPVPGRFEVVSESGVHPFSVVVDYAHTPDALAGVLATARSIAPAGDVVVVFGCGGDRDADKRPLMGAAAAANADRVIVTSDNPRHEDPQAIIDAALSGIERRYGGVVRVEPDRRRAIELAIGDARPGDVIVIAGKGHETTQTIGDIATPFDDRSVAREVLAELHGTTFDQSPPRKSSVTGEQA
jgi:UDP-N-acetylmuramoyl-L-alanyl-D-glutamate--2,6-diaminopimelate ligase